MSRKKRDGEVNDVDDSEKNNGVSAHNLIRVQPVQGIATRPPSEFHFHCPKELSAHRHRWDRFRIVAGSNQKPDEYQISCFLYTMGEKAEDIIDCLPLSAVDKLVYDKIMQGFEDYLFPK